LEAGWDGDGMEKWGVDRGNAVGELMNLRELRMKEPEKQSNDGEHERCSRGASRSTLGHPRRRWRGGPRGQRSGGQPSVLPGDRARRPAAGLRGQDPGHGPAPRRGTDRDHGRFLGRRRDTAHSRVHRSGGRERASGDGPHRRPGGVDREHAPRGLPTVADPFGGDRDLEAPAISPRRPTLPGPEPRGGRGLLAARMGRDCPRHCVEQGRPRAEGGRRRGRRPMPWICGDANLRKLHGCPRCAGEATGAHRTGGGGEGGEVARRRTRMGRKSAATAQTPGQR
jgi:hypothetical protein